jgi:ABC-type lipoprotein release transport system permease subunit
LFAKKSHNAINIISLVSAVGVAVGAFALVVALSVYNGLDSLIKSLYNTLSPDLKITAVEGKVFDARQFDFDSVKSIAEVAFYSEALEENAALRYRNQQHLATVRGVDETFLQRSGVAGSIIEGEAAIRKGDVDMVIVGKIVAGTLNLRPSFFDMLWIYFPKRGLRLQSINPNDALNREYLKPAGIFSIEMDADSKYVLAPLDVVQRLLGYDREVSSVELYLHPRANPKSVKEKVQKILGSSLKVKTREEQNEVLFRMMQGEKWAIFFILTFVLLVASFNSIGALTMLIIEKKRDVKILYSLGAQDSLVRRIFISEGVMISFLGCTAGVILGLAACYMQIHFKLIKLGGSFVVDAYPVKVNPVDISLVLLTVLLIGYAANNIPVRYLLKKNQLSK